MSVQVLCGDCVEVMAGMEPESFHAIVCDPPYHLTTGKNGGTGIASLNVNSPAGRSRISTGFMGTAWDGGDVAFRPTTWQAALRVLKPGGYLVAFASCRGYHRMVCAIEDAGFLIHPMLAWITGSGFPKATNFTDPFDERLLGFCEEDDPKNWEMSRSHWATYWEGWRHGLQSLKPAIEPICCAQKPFSEPTGRENVLKHGTGALNIDRSRVATDAALSRQNNARANSVYNEGKWGTGVFGTGDERGGRWPSNVCHDGSFEVLAAFARAGDAGGGSGSTRGGNADGNVIYGADFPRGDMRTVGLGDAGTAARFFYTAKAAAHEREGGHPTIKPVSLMEWLLGLVVPPGGRVLDPFAGTGSTLVAADRLGIEAVGIEQDAKTCADAEAKIRRMRARRMIGDDVAKEAPVAGQLGLFDSA